MEGASRGSGGVRISGYAHVLVIAASRVLLIRGDVEFSARFDRDVLVTWSVTRADLRSFLSPVSALKSGTAADAVHYSQYRGQWQEDDRAGLSPLLERCR